MIPVWLPVAVPWAGAALLAALPRRPAWAGPAVAAASFAAAVALCVAGGGPARPPDAALGSALLLAGSAAALLAVLADAGARSGTPGRDDRFSAAGFPLLQGAQALAVLATDAAVSWIGLAVGVGAGAALVALSGGRRASAAAWGMLLLCGAGLALALFGLVLLRVRGAAGAAPGLSGLGFVLLLVGYGALAGLAPLHAWFPRAVAVSAPPVGAVLAGLLLPTALHALLRAAPAPVGPAFGGLPVAALLAAVGFATALLAAVSAWRPGASAKELPGWSGAGLAGLAAVGFGLGGAAGNLAGVLLLLAAPFCIGAAVLGAAAGGPVAALGRVSLAGVPPFAPFVALALLFSTVAALPGGWALPLGAALLAAAAAQLGAAGRRRRGGAPLVGNAAAGRGGALVVVPPWLLLGLALALGWALPEPVAAVLAEAAARLAR